MAQILMYNGNWTEVRKVLLHRKTRQTIENYCVSMEIAKFVDKKRINVLKPEHRGNGITK